MPSVSFYSVAAFRRHFRAPLCSRAGLLALCLACASLIIPLFWSFASHSFWLKENTFRVQPIVSFKKDIILGLDGQNSLDGSSGNYFFSTNSAMNTIFNDAVLSVPTIKTAEVDENHDGVSDYLGFSISVPLPDSFDIYHVRLALMFRYELQSEDLRLLMQSMAMMDEMSSLPASSINVNGKLRLVQQTLLVANSNNVRYDTPVVNYTLSTSGPSTAALTWPEIIHSYLDRELQTKYEYPPVNWGYFRAQGQPFVISGKLRYTTETVSYKPGVMEVLKFGWIQYLSYLVLSATFSWLVYGWCIRSQLVPTHVSVDSIPSGATTGFKPHLF